MRMISSLADCIDQLPPKPTIVMHSALAEPNRLGAELASLAPSLAGATIYNLFPMGAAPYALAEVFNLNTFVPGSAMPGPINEGRAHALRIPLSQIPKLFEAHEIVADVVLLQLSPDNSEEQGSYSLGLAVDYMPSVLAQNPLVVAEINPEMPYTFGDTRVDETQIDFAIPAAAPPQTMLVARANDIEQMVAANVAKLIGNNCTLQYGIGAIPETVLAYLSDRKNLRIHSGLVTDPIIPLIEAGVVNDEITTTSAGGSTEFYRFLDRNSQIQFRPCSHTHGFETLSEIDNLFAINSCLQIDLYGRVNAERIGSRIISCPGGQPDFAAGANASKGGANILAIRSTSRKGDKSSIISSLPDDTPETVPADHVDYLVTEYGIAELSGLSGDERRKKILSVAHPEFAKDLKFGN